MQQGDRVYYNYMDKNGMTQKFPAVVLSISDDDIEIRIGRLNVGMQKIETAVFIVKEVALEPRNTPCNYEDELLGLA